MAKARTTVALATSIALLCVGAASGQSSTTPASASKLGAPAADYAEAAPEADPGSLFNFSGEIGQVLQFSVVGSDQGTVWGDGTYTSDSVLAAAAVHAGLLAPGQAGILSVEIVPGLQTYDGALRNGVASSPYGPWDVAYRFVGAEVTGAVAVPMAPADLTAYRGQDGKVLNFEVTGAVDGSVWGDGIYTDDSNVGAAAVHAGLLEPGETGALAIEIMPGQQSYGGSTANGVASGSYGEWGGSFMFLPALSAKLASKLAN